MILLSDSNEFCAIKVLGVRMQGCEVHQLLFHISQCHLLEKLNVFKELAVNRESSLSEVDADLQPQRGITVLVSLKDEDFTVRNIIAFECSILFVQCICRIIERIDSMQRVLVRSDLSSLAGEIGTDILLGVFQRDVGVEVELAAVVELAVQHDINSYLC